MCVWRHYAQNAASSVALYMPDMQSNHTICPCNGVCAALSQQVQQLIATTVQQMGGVDIMVANAGEYWAV